MYDQNPIINEMCLSVINDGDGEECGLTYPQRCSSPEYRLMEFISACARQNANSVKRGQPKANAKEIRKAAEIVQQYYENHTAEMRLLS